MLLSLTASQIGAYSFSEANFYLLPTRGWELLIGALSAIALFKPLPRLLPARFNEKTLYQGASLLGAVLILIALFTFNKNTPFPSLYALLPTAGTALIILFARHDTLVGRLLGMKAPVGIGKISYSAYLWHQPLFAFAVHGLPGEHGSTLFSGLIVLSFALAYLSWRYVETPFRNRAFLSRRTLFSLALGGMVFFILVGALGVASKGFLNRYPVEDQPLAGFDFKKAEEYTPLVYKEKLDKPFTDAPLKKILIIGDSYGEDLLSALHEAGLDQKVQFSTFRLSAKCGNLFLEPDVILPHVDAVDRPRCLRDNWYHKGDLLKRMEEADHIWIISSWKKWQAELLPQSLERIQKQFKARVLVFGRKNLGDVKLRPLLAIPFAQRRLATNPPNETHIETNRLMRDTLPKELFVDVSAYFCPDEKACPLMTEDGHLISFDGGHVTKEGAKLFGEKLATDPRLRAVLELPPLSAATEKSPR